MSGLGKIDVGDKNETVHCFHCHESGVNRVFVDNPMFLQKVWGMAGGKIYDSVASTDNHDTQLCFSVLCLAAQTPRIVKFRNQLVSGPYVDLLPSMDPIRMAVARMSISGPSSGWQSPVRCPACDHRFFMDLMVKITTLERTVLCLLFG